MAQRWAWKGTFPHVIRKKAKALAFLHAQRLFFRGLRHQARLMATMDSTREPTKALILLELIGLHLRTSKSEGTGVS